ncbi:MAG: helix-turn-helix transcriptional regulator [Burkholderiales bacterium]|uniref:Helix-turn-helix domain-containing protein n=1 Tax=Ottowia pentelensis TaxID=511108 RepID=A0ABV6PUC5_9BURK|nr:helix-turn-helix transcriptional regulator [Ottowia sp.]MBN9405992.1 helix-turn-helix transcriptional regulator [Burkholderiales bacterium]HMN58103.1 helix-turn-helix transcriptional regulator [Ottowia sp.]
MSRAWMPHGAARREVGPLLRAWRERRKLSQMALALDVGVSPRHLSFVETGRSRPSAELLLSMSEHLAVPLRQRNELLLAAGYAPRYSETRLDAPGLDAVRSALQRLLDAHEPYPGLALDRCGNVVLANAAAQRMTALLPPALRQPTLNIYRASLHPEGFAAATHNFADWARHLVQDLGWLGESTGDAELAALAEEVLAYPNVAALMASPPPAPDGTDGLVLTCELQIGEQRLTLFTARAAIGAPRDVTLAELTLELFYPADVASEALLRAAATSA